MANSSSEYDVYIAYASEDLDVVQEIYNFLAAFRHKGRRRFTKIFFDKEKTKSKEDLNRMFDKALCASDQMVFLSSASSKGKY